MLDKNWLKRNNRITKKGGYILGFVTLNGEPMKRDTFNKLKSFKRLQFVHTPTRSGEVYWLRDGRICIGASNYKNAGRGFCFRDFQDFLNGLDDIECVFHAPFKVRIYNNNEIVRY